MDQLLRALFWTVPFAVTVVLSVFLLYLSRKDGDKRKIMFMLCFAFASVGYSNLMLQRYGVPTLWDNNYKWSFVPVTAAAMIATMSSLLKLKNFDRPFKCFLFILGASIVLLVFPSAAEAFRVPLLGAFASLSLPASIYLFVKRRDNSDLMFVLAFSCFIFSWIALDIGLAEEITVLLTLFGIVFTALMFNVTKDQFAGDLASVFILQGELEKTREDLRQTQTRAREELEESEERYRTLCEDARFAMLRLNRKGTVTYVNRVIEEYGLEKKDIIGKSMLKFIPKRNRPKLFKEHINVILGKNAEGETEIISPKGKIIVEYASNPVRQDGKIVGCETLLRDITEKKEMERQLEEYSAQLEAKVEERTAELSDANAQIRKHAGQLEVEVEERTRELVDAQRKLLKSERLAAIGELAGMVGHDLRNPLTSIAGAVYYLKAKYDSKIDEKGKEMLEIIEKDIEFSNKIINDLLDYSREIRLELAETTPKSMLKEAYSSLEIPQNIQVQDETEDKPRMRADVPKMKRVFVNIIKNAFDAMPKGGVLAIGSEKIEKHVSFSFTDTGTGISEEGLGKLWTPFFSTKAKGMGLGLPICKRIVEAHGGTISVESTVGKGTIFRINVPIEPETEETKDVWVNLPETIQLEKKDNPGRVRI
ncbi:MAG: ATP-binding protein [Candidatus Bathyarchaeia archaeon]